MPKGHNHKGRSTTTERFVSLPHYMLRSAAWRSLSPVERSIYIELAQLYSGTNNGCLALSARDAAKQVGCSKKHGGVGVRRVGAEGFYLLPAARPLRPEDASCRRVWSDTLPLRPHRRARVESLHELAC
jgi:hypothetical protein